MKSQLVVCDEIHHAVLGKTIAFTVSAAFGIWASFLGYHCIEITSSWKILSALYYQSLSVHVKLGPVYMERG